MRAFLWALTQPVCLQAPDWQKAFHQATAGIKCGMCMVIRMYAQSGTLQVLCAYEDGTLVLWNADFPCKPQFQERLQKEPIMALSINDSLDGDSQLHASVKLHHKKSHDIHYIHGILGGSSCQCT